MGTASSCATSIAADVPGCSKAHFPTCSDPCACRPCSRLAGAQPGQQRAAHEAAYDGITPCLHSCIGHVQSYILAQHPCSLWCLQACTARVLMSSLAGHAETGALQQHVQLAVKELRKLQALANAGDWGLKAAVQVTALSS